MKIFTISTAAAALFAVSAHAEVMEGSYSNKMTNVYATQLDGANYNDKDSACKDAFGQHVGEVISGSYKIDTAANTGGAELVYKDVTIPLMPMKFGDAWGFYTTDIPDPLSNQHIEKIHVMPGATSESTRTEIVLTPTPDNFRCVVANHSDMN